MKSFIIVLSVITSFNLLAIDVENLDIDNRTKNQIIAGFTLKESIDLYSNNQDPNDFATVGSDSNCDYRFGSTKIQDAIDLGESEIRIAMNDTYNVGLAINDKSIIIRGGYTDCTAAAANIQTDRTRLGHLAMESVITISGSSQRNTIILDSLELTEGSEGLKFDNADVEVMLIKLLIFNNNTLSSGGGIIILGGNTDINIEDTIIFSNEALYGGGGIFCSGNDGSILLNKDSGIALNKATLIDETSVIVSGANGGGLYIIGGCSFLSYAGGSGGLFDFRGIYKNEATQTGGGLFIANGSIVTLMGHQVCMGAACMGSNDNPANLTSNLAIEPQVFLAKLGGGAHVLDADSELSIYAGFVSENRALTSGGAIAVKTGATFNTGRISKDCWSQEHCNFYEKNTANYGGLLYSTGLATINSTVIENNRANNGTVLRLGADSITTINSSIIHHNGNNQADGFDDVNVIQLSVNNAKLIINHTTIADNNAMDSVFNVGNNSSPNSLISSSIIHDSSSGPIFSSNTSNTIALNCTIMHEENSVTTQSFSAVVNDPGFVDRVNRDYHLNPNTSIAVDFCFENNSSQLDIDFEPRGFDDPTANDNLGVFDVGADETYTNDIIFMNSFN